MLRKTSSIDEERKRVILLRNVQHLSSSNYFKDQCLRHFSLHKFRLSNTVEIWFNNDKRHFRSLSKVHFTEETAISKMILSLITKESSWKMIHARRKETLSIFSKWVLTSRWVSFPPPIEKQLLSRETLFLFLFFESFCLRKIDSFRFQREKSSFSFDNCFCRSVFFSVSNRTSRMTKCGESSLFDVWV